MKTKKIVVVGGVAGGASAAARIRRLDEEAEIIVFERGEHVSFSNCSLPYYLSKTVSNRNALIMMTPQDFQDRHNIDVRVHHEGVRILRKEQCVIVREANGKEYKESYDRLILAPGAKAVVPKSIEGTQNENVFTIRNVNDISRLQEFIEHRNAKAAVVIGGGFVGLEIAENLRKAELSVTLVEGADQIMAPFDHDMVQMLHKELLDHGVQLHLSSVVTAITPNSVKAMHQDQEIVILAEVVVLSIGVAPETSLAAEAGLEIGSSRGIKVNHNYQTSDSSIYAVGDAIESFDRMGQRYGSFAQAGPAQKQARIAADHIFGQFHRNTGYIATACLRIFEQNVACTGMNEKAAQRAGIPYEVAYVLPSDKVSIMPNSNYMAFKLLFEVPTGRILGAQASGKGDVTRRMDVIATLLMMGGTLEDLKDLELCYSPVYGTAKDVVNLAALVGLNLLHNRVQQVRVEQARALVESNAYIIDVRERKEFQAGHLNNAVNIPLSEFRSRIAEVPRDIPVYLHCRTSQRSYYAICELLGNGYTNVYNISGSFLGICLYEYYRDQCEGREKIMTAYQFR